MTSERLRTFLASCDPRTTRLDRAPLELRIYLALFLIDYRAAIQSGAQHTDAVYYAFNRVLSSWRLKN